MDAQRQVSRLLDEEHRANLELLGRLEQRLAHWPRGAARGDTQLTGLLEAKDLALRSLVDGIVFRGGELRATLAGERIVIERFRLEGRGGAERGGLLQATGSAEWRRVQRDGATVREPLIELDVNADKLRASSRPDRRVTVSGQVRARLEGAALQLRGNLRADECSKNEAARNPGRRHDAELTRPIIGDHREDTDRQQQRRQRRSHRLFQPETE